MNQTAAAGFENLIGYYDPPVQVRSSLSLSHSSNHSQIYCHLSIFCSLHFGACFSNFCVVFKNVIAQVFSSSVIAFDSIQFLPNILS